MSRLGDCGVVERHISLNIYAVISTDAWMFIGGWGAETNREIVLFHGVRARGVDV